MTRLVFLVLLLPVMNCGSSEERLKHPKTVIVEAERCAKDRGIQLTASASEILVEISQIEESVGSYEQACRDDDDKTIRRAFMCVSKACEKLPKQDSTKHNLGKLLLDNVKDKCQNELDAFAKISTPKCTDWAKKVYQKISNT